MWVPILQLQRGKKIDEHPTAEEHQRAGSLQEKKNLFSWQTDFGGILHNVTE